METSVLIFGANQWTGFYMILASVMKGLKDGDIINQQFNRFLTAAGAFYICTYEYALDNLPRNDDLLINARVSLPHDGLNYFC